MRGVETSAPPVLDIQRNKPHIAYISGGSNIGSKLLNCKSGIAALSASGKSAIEGQSGFYKTEPVDYKDQDWFINCAVKIKTALNPFELLKDIKRIEKDAGRIDDTIRFGPRILDLDVILYDNVVMHSPKLVIPHPRMHKRRFVLRPICDIDSSIIHPVFKKDLQTLLDRLDRDFQRIVFLKCDY